MNLLEELAPRLGGDDAEADVLGVQARDEVVRHQHLLLGLGRHAY